MSIGRMSRRLKLVDAGKFKLAVLAEVSGDAIGVTRVTQSENVLKTQYFQYDLYGNSIASALKLRSWFDMPDSDKIWLFRADYFGTGATASLLRTNPGQLIVPQHLEGKFNYCICTLNISWVELPALLEILQSNCVTNLSDNQTKCYVSDQLNAEILTVNSIVPSWFSRTWGYTMLKQVWWTDDYL